MRRPALGHILGYTALTIILTAGAAQSLAGSNTVYSDDIVDSTITTADLKNGAVNSAKIQDGSVTGADVNERSLVAVCPAGMTRVSDLCYTSARTAAAFETALGDCAEGRLRLPTLAEGKLVAIHSANASFLWTDNYYYDGGLYGAIVVYNGGQVASYVSNVDLRAYRCVTTVGAHP